MKQYLGFFIQRHVTNSRAAQEEKSFQVVRLNPLWTNNVCTNLLAVQPVVETRLRRTDWLLCFTLKNSVWLFLCCLEGALHHKQTAFSKDNQRRKDSTSALLRWNNNEHIY